MSSAAIETGPTTPLAERLRSRARSLGSWLRLLAKLATVLYLASLVFLACWVAVPSVVGGFRPVLIDGGSMEPALSVGDITLVRPGVPTTADVVLGQIVTFRDSGGRVITHRVIAVDDDGSLVTKGDANADRDGATVPLDRVVGTGWLAVPMAGLPIHWLHSASPLLAVWLVVTAIALAVAVGIRTPRRVVPGGASVDDPAIDEEWRWPTWDPSS